MELLTQLIAANPDPALNALVRRTCAATLSLPPLPSEGQPLDDPELAQFAEQFTADVAMISPSQRTAFMQALGGNAFRTAALIFIADFVPRVAAGFLALGLPPIALPDAWDPHADALDLLLNHFTGTVGALRGLDPVTTEVIRLRGATAHNCRLCKSLRETTALDAGGSESLYSDIEQFEASARLTDAHKAALRYVDALVWSPARISADVADSVMSHFSADQAVEITLDVMRNATNKIAVALGGDEPRVSEGTELYRLGADGVPVFS